MNELGMPSVFEYRDYFEYLSNLSNYLQTQKGLSARAITQLWGFASPGYFKMLLERKRGLTVTSAKKLAHRVAMQRSEAAYFLKLVELAQAKTDSHRQGLLTELETIKNSRRTHLLRDEQLAFLKDPVATALLEALSFVDSSAMEAQEIANRFGLATDRLQSALDLLVDCQLLEKKNGKYRREHGALETPEVIAASVVQQYHVGALEHSIKCIKELDTSRRFAGAQILSVNREDLQDIQLALFDFLKSMNKRFGGKQGVDAVYQLAVNLSPLLTPPS